MTNYEAYKEEMIKMLLDEGTVSFGVVKGKIKTCYRAKCSECNFNGVPSCRDARKDWLHAEYVEQPKLTQRERKLCEVIETGWIAREKNGMLFLYDEEPGKGAITWSREASASRLDKILLGGFAFIRWQDDEPWTVEDLLKLEVEE